MDANNPVLEGFVCIPIREFRTNVMYRKSIPAKINSEVKQKPMFCFFVMFGIFIFFVLSKSASGCFFFFRGKTFVLCD